MYMVTMCVQLQGPVLQQRPATVLGREATRVGSLCRHPQRLVLAASAKPEL